MFYSPYEIYWVQILKQSKIHMPIGYENSNRQKKKKSDINLVKKYIFFNNMLCTYNSIYKKY